MCMKLKVYGSDEGINHFPAATKFEWLWANKGEGEGTGKDSQKEQVAPNKIFLDTKRPICDKIMNIGSWWQAQEVKKEVLKGGARVFVFFLLLLSEA